MENLKSFQESKHSQKVTVPSFTPSTLLTAIRSLQANYSGKEAQQEAVRTSETTAEELVISRFLALASIPS